MKRRPLNGGASRRVLLKLVFGVVRPFCVVGGVSRLGSCAAWGCRSDGSGGWRRSDGSGGAGAAASIAALAKGHSERVVAIAAACEETSATTRRFLLLAELMRCEASVL